MSAPAPLAPGAALGDFVLDRKIAVGGMAEIWRADGPRGQVALKVLRPELSHEAAFVAMFEDEVRIATRLQHPNIVEVFGVHSSAGHVFQSMELLEGLDLRRLLSHLARSGARLPLPIVLFVAREVTRALGHAHARKTHDGRALDIVHRDVSPHNIMIGWSGRVKLLDFGVARAAERAVKTKTGVIKGKLGYMAPEQALAVGVTPQTDIFATGVVLWEMLTVERLFVADSDVELLERVIAARVPDLREKAPSVPEDVARLVSTMLAQRAPQRPSGMDEVERSLTRAIALHCPPESATERGLAEWLAGHGPAGAPSEAPAAGHLAPADDDTRTDPGPDATQPSEELDVTATYVRPERRGEVPDATWPGHPAARDGEEGAADGGGPADRSEPTDPPAEDPSDPTDPSADDARGAEPDEGPADVPTEISTGLTPGLVAPELPRAPLDAAPDVARTWVDMGPPPGLSELGAPTWVAPSDTDERPAPTPSPASAPPPKRADKIRMPTRSEVIRAVENQATVEVEADPEVAKLARGLFAGPAAPVVSDPTDESEGSAAEGEEPTPDESDAPLGAPTLHGDLVAPELPAAPAPRVAFAASDDSGGYEHVGPTGPSPSLEAPAPTPAPTPAPRPEPRPAPSSGIGHKILPAITIVLAALVLALTLMLLQDQ